MIPKNLVSPTYPWTISLIDRPAAHTTQAKLLSTDPQENGSSEYPRHEAPAAAPEVVGPSSLLAGFHMEDWCVEVTAATHIQQKICWSSLSEILLCRVS